MDEVIDDLRTTLAALRARPECQGDKIGIVGYCYGGLLTYTTAARLDAACASSYYGGGIVDYLDEAGHINRPMQFHFGAQDAGIPLGHVEQIRQAVAHKAQVEVFVYDGADHGFHCDQRGSYDEASAALAWQRTLDLFHQPP